MPDILVVENNIPVENYIAKGLIADVGPFIEKDEELSKNEYMENVFRAYMINDKLYHVITRFMVGAVIGKKSIFGEMAGFTMGELLALLDTMPEGTQAFGNTTRNDFIYYIMQYCGSDYIDLTTGKCSFDSQGFIETLEYAKTLPQEIQYNYDDASYWTDYENQYRENRTLLMPLSFYDFASVTIYPYGYFGEEVVYMGFPNEGRNGSTINVTMSFVMSAKSKNLEGVWEFLRYYLTDEYQAGEEGWGFPVKKDVFMEKAAEAMEKPYNINDNNEKVEYDYTWHINDEEIIIPPMTQKQLDVVVAFFESVDRRAYTNEDVQNIISEEIEPFFNGQKTAQDVAQIIQSRAQLLVNENR
jgi:ABC-type glycerol-3-phosphate transport system substrate-binding protein